MVPDNPPTFTRDQKALVAKRFRQWLEAKHTNVNAVCPLLGISRPQKLYDFINHGIASAKTVSKVLQLMEISIDDLMSLKRRRRRRRRTPLHQRLLVTLSCAQEDLNLLCELMETLRSLRGIKRPATLRTTYTNVGELVGHLLVRRYGNARTLRQRAHFDAINEEWRHRGTSFRLLSPRLFHRRLKKTGTSTTP